MAHLYIIRGVPGSGKSTMARKMVDHGMADHHFEADMWMVNENGDYRFHRNHLSDVHEKCFSATKDHLSRWCNVVVSNTFTRRWEFQKYIMMAEELGANVTAIVCQGNYKNIHGVSREDVHRMRDRFEY